MLLQRGKGSSKTFNVVAKGYKCLHEVQGECKVFRVAARGYMWLHGITCDCTQSNCVRIIVGRSNSGAHIGKPNGDINVKRPRWLPHNGGCHARQKQVYWKCRRLVRKHKQTVTKV